ncbi:antibiotic biosynthesis monooxygenase [uncultured Campylobacter sp.]|uniref:putative quinol monooxygenase n=1 Tax=uncultured Campylobacter sp. TaxID=218934 RepID=UPI00261B1E08|nr:antibiotic biosynthesis monooxygenase [uncultured Campylobacter sp.]
MIKKAILPCLTALNLLAAEPKIGLFALETTPEHLNELTALGMDNLSNSQKLESGTLAMFFTSAEGEPEKIYVLEIYADEAAYERHASSEHFKRFLNGSANLLASKHKFDVETKFLGQKKLSEAALNSAHMRLAKITVRPEDNAKFEGILMKEMKASLAKESGVLALFTFTLKDAPNQWIFFEIYAGQAAYEAHRQTPHFKEFVQARDDMVAMFEGFALKNNYSFSKMKPRK